ncbi:MAG: homoserine kinase [Chloroflexi bacterium]|nr:homoserine kinase [Chloroflexota bacterium]
MRFAADHVRVTVPGSAGNLGPGFDCLGMALGVVDTVEVRLLASTDVIVEVTGEGEGKVPLDGSHLFVSTLRAALDRVDAPGAGLHVTAHNSIPHGQGLGSSAATAIAALVAARALIAEPDAPSDEDILTMATALEGHPDNAAPALYGGAVVCWQDDTGAHATPLVVADGVETAVVIPHGVVPTVEARASLPASVPHRDAAFNASRAALLVHALAGSPALLFDATEDRLHQGYRAGHMPSAIAMMKELRERGLAAVVSGAGPAVLVLGTNLAGDGFADGPLAWADGIGDDTWRCILTSERVPGASVERLG